MIEPIEEAGIKYDMGKPRLAECYTDFRIPLALVCQVWEFGANKYGVSNWTQLKDGESRYTNALVRHLIWGEPVELRDKESGLPHAAHVAWNALARLYFIAKKEGLLEEPVQESHEYYFEGKPLGHQPASSAYKYHTDPAKLPKQLRLNLGEKYESDSQI